MALPMTADQANAIYDVLVEHAGAPSGQRTMFVAVQTYSLVYEYRFQGNLGYGGKFWRTTGIHREDPDLRWSVNCYSEHETPERLATIERTNAALAELRERVGVAL